MIWEIQVNLGPPAALLPVGPFMTLWAREVRGAPTMHCAWEPSASGSAASKPTLSLVGASDLTG